MHLNEEQLMIRRSVRELVADRVAPRAAQIDETGEFPWDVVDLFRKQDIFSLPFPPEHGGLTGSALTLHVAIEEIARVCATGALLLVTQALGGYPIMLAGTDEQRRRWLPDLAGGRRLAAYALAEADAGSDPAAMSTRAERHGGDYLITGTKTWVTDGGVADIIVVFARTDTTAPGDGLTAFVVEREQARGLTASTVDGRLGIRGCDTADLHLDGVRVPAENRLGEEGEGFRLALRVVDRSRPCVAAQALGIAQGALDYAVGYARERRQFGRPIAEFQGIQFMLADMEAATQAARALVHAAGEAIDGGSDEVTHLAAVCRLVAGDTAVKVTTDAVQVLGGYGYVREYPVERMMRDAKMTQIHQGGGQVQRAVIAGDLLRG